MFKLNHESVYGKGRVPERRAPARPGWHAAAMLAAALGASLGWVPAASAGPLTLAQVIDRALGASDKVRAGRERIQQREEDRATARGQFLPAVTLSGGYTHLNDPLSINLDPIRDALIQIQAANMTEFANGYQLMQGGAPLTSEQRAAVAAQNAATLDGAIPHFVQTFKDQDYFTLTLGAVQPLFVGGKLLAAWRASGAEVEAARFELERTRNEVTGEAIGRYLDVVLLQEVVRVRKDVLGGMQGHQQTAETLWKGGMVPEVQVYRAKVAVAEAERAVFDDETRLDLARVALTESLGETLGPGGSLAIGDRLTFRPYATSLSAALASANQTQPMLRLLAEKRRAAHQKTLAMRGDFLPQVAAFGRYEILKDDLSALEPEWAVGVQVNWNLFAGTRDLHKVRSAKHQEGEVAALEADARRSIDLWVNKSWRDVAAAAERYRKLDASLALATENQRLSEQRFQNGYATSLDVIDARLALERIEIDRLVSLRDYYRALADLSIAIGQPRQILDVWTGKE